MTTSLSLVSKEFQAWSAQMRQVVKPHSPSVGAGHEVLMRRFLRDYLPSWIGVAHGFIRTHEGKLSGQTDVLLYNAMYYAPLYRVDDFVVVQPESVVAIIEVKTTVNKRDFVHRFSTSPRQRDGQSSTCRHVHSSTLQSQGHQGLHRCMPSSRHPRWSDPRFLVWVIEVLP